MTCTHLHSRRRALPPLQDLVHVRSVIFDYVSVAHSPPLHADEPTKLQQCPRQTVPLVICLVLFQFLQCGTNRYVSLVSFSIAKSNNFCAAIVCCSTAGVS